MRSEIGEGVVEALETTEGAGAVVEDAGDVRLKLERLVESVECFVVAADHQQKTAVNAVDRGALLIEHEGGVDRAQGVHAALQPGERHGAVARVRGSSGSSSRERS